MATPFSYLLRDPVNESLRWIKSELMADLDRLSQTLMSRTIIYLSASWISMAAVSRNFWKSSSRRRRMCVTQFFLNDWKRASYFFFFFFSSKGIGNEFRSLYSQYTIDFQVPTNDYNFSHIALKWSLLLGRTWDCILISQCWVQAVLWTSSRFRY